MNVVMFHAEKCEAAYLAVLNALLSIAEGKTLNLRFAHSCAEAVSHVIDIARMRGVDNAYHSARPIVIPQTIYSYSRDGDTVIIEQTIIDDRPAFENTDMAMLGILIANRHVTQLVDAKARELGFNGIKVNATSCYCNQDGGVRVETTLIFS